MRTFLYTAHFCTPKGLWSTKTGLVQAEHFWDAETVVEKAFEYFPDFRHVRIAPLLVRDDTDTVENLGPSI